VLAGFAIALIGLLPRLSQGSWGALGLCLLLSLVGSALQLSHWLLDISPFTHIPRALGGSVSVTPLIALLVVAIAIGTAGLTGLRRRAIPT
jgi:ABC-2 type transport system permease protein